jgi:hypothetical protein
MIKVIYKYLVNEFHKKKKKLIMRIQIQFLSETIFYYSLFMSGRTPNYQAHSYENERLNT